VEVHQPRHHKVEVVKEVEMVKEEVEMVKEEEVEMVKEEEQRWKSSLMSQLIVQLRRRTSPQTIIGRLVKTLTSLSWAHPLPLSKLPRICKTMLNGRSRQLVLHQRQPRVVLVRQPSLVPR